MPDNPAAWLTTAARRRAIDAIRRDAALRARLPLLVSAEENSAEAGTAGQRIADAEAAADRLSDAVPDERLRLIFICCHPALAQEAQLALTLRLVCGMTVPRHRSRVPRLRADHGRPDHPSEKEDLGRPDPLSHPPAAKLADRPLGRPRRHPPALHRRPHGAVGPALVRADLVDRAMRLARMLRELMPAAPTSTGCTRCCCHR